MFGAYLHQGNIIETRQQLCPKQLINPTTIGLFGLLMV
jgi:hypothetical protein